MYNKVLDTTIVINNIRKNNVGVTGIYCWLGGI